MTPQEQQEFRDYTKQLADLAAEPCWTAMMMSQMGQLLEKLTEYCAVCDCTEARNRQRERVQARLQEVMVRR